MWWQHNLHKNSEGLHYFFYWVMAMTDRLIQGVTSAWYKVLPQSFCMQLILHLCENDCLNDMECVTVVHSHFHTSHACSRWLPFSLFPLACLFFCLSLSLSLCLVVSGNSPGRCIALGGTRDYVLYSLSLSYSPSPYFSFSVAVNFLCNGSHQLISDW